MATKRREYRIRFSEEGLKRIQRNMQGVESQTAGLVGRLKQLGGVLATGVAVNSIINVATDIKNTTAQYEALQTRLNSLYNDVERGEEAFRRFSEIAATTPFSLPEVVEAGAALKSFGLDAENTLKVTADLAAFMGTTIPDAASALGRAFASGAGAADIFRERGILTLIQTKQGIDDLTKLTLPEFRKAMFDTFEDASSGIAGATTALSNTIGGLESNLGDAFGRLQNEIGGEFAEAYKDSLRGMISVTEQLVQAFEDGGESARRFAAFRVDTNRQVSSLEELRDKYTEVSSKIETGEAKQEDLNKVVADVARILPGAVSSFNEYGEAVAINTDVLNAFISAQKQVLQRTEADAFESLKGDIQDVVRELERAETGLRRTQARITEIDGKSIEELRRELAELATQNLPDFAIDSRNIDQLIGDSNELTETISRNRKELENLGRELSVFFDVSESADLSEIRTALGLTEDQFKRVIPAIEAYRKAIAATNEGDGNKRLVDANRRRQLEALQLQRRLLEIQTSETLSEYEKQVQSVILRYDNEIRKAGTAKEQVVELERIKSLEIEQINQNLNEKLLALEKSKIQEVDKLVKERIDSVNAELLKIQPVDLSEILKGTAKIDIDVSDSLKLLEQQANNARFALADLANVTLSDSIRDEVAAVAGELRKLEQIDLGADLSRQVDDLNNILRSAGRVDVEGDLKSKVDSINNILESIGNADISGDLRAQVDSIKTQISGIGEIDLSGSIPEQVDALREHLGRIGEVEIRSLLTEQLRELEDQLQKISNVEVAAELKERIESLKGSIESVGNEKGFDILTGSIKETRKAAEELQEIGEVDVKPSQASIDAWGVLRGQIRETSDIISNALIKQWEEGENALESFADAFTDMLKRMVAEMLARAALFGFLNIVTGGAAGAILGSSFGGFVTGSGRGSAPLSSAPAPTQQLFAPQVDSFLVRGNDTPPAQTVNNITIQAVDAPSFETFLRERGGARVIAQTTSELV